MRALRPRGISVPTALTAAAVLLSGFLTVAVTLTPSVRFAYRSLIGHVVLETFDACAAGVIAALFYGRAQRTRHRADVMLACAFLLLAVTSGYLSVLPALSTARNDAETVWLPLTTRLIAAGCIAVAAAEARQPQPVRPRTASLAAAVAVGAFTLAAILAAAFGARLPHTIDPTISPQSSSTPLLSTAAVINVAQLAHACLYAFAALAFTREARRSNDALTAWLGAGCAVAMMARVNYVLFPSLYSEWLYVGDFLRTTFYLMLIVGGALELRGYWQVQQEAAVFAERRRIARELHDGTIQEIGYIRTLAREMSRSAGDHETATAIASAADRALAEARGALDALTAPPDEPLDRVLRRTAEEVTDRYDVPLRMLTLGVPRVTPTQREALARIVREAVLNAVRHGSPSCVHVELHDRALEVRDDGTGFDVERTGSGRYGLTSMRDRAAAVGASLVVTSGPERGTTVKVVWDG